MSIWINLLDSLMIRALLIIISALCMILSFVHFLEVYKVVFQNGVENYPFGKEGPVPYYYKSEGLFISINLFWAIGFSSLGVFSMNSLKNRNVKRLSVILIFTLIALISWFVQSSFQEMF